MTRFSPRSGFRRRSPRSGGAYLKLERKVGDFATAAVAVQLTLAADGTVQAAGIALTNMAETPARAAEAETFLKGKKPTAETLAEAGRLAAEAGSPTGDWKGSAEYKRNVARVLAARALAKAIERRGRQVTWPPIRSRSP